MGDFDFSQTWDRHGTGSLKWDTSAKDVLPFWVADMDFTVPPGVVEALADRLSHPIFGYGLLDKELIEALVNWYKKRHGLNLGTQDILLAPGVMPSLSLAIRSLTVSGDGIMIFTPVYQPFFDVITLNDRTLVEFPLSLEGRTWTFDSEILRQTLETKKSQGKPVKTLLFCSPHNPVGRVWKTSELEELSKLARDFDLLILSDEIHQDLVFPPHRHQVLAGFDENLRGRTVVFSSGGKTFNLAGLPLSHMVVFDPELKKRLKRGLEAEFFHHPNILAQIAAKTVFQEGAPWLEALLPYLEENYRVLCRALPVGMVETLPAPLEGTYLAWVDFSPMVRKMGLSGDEELAKILEAKARIRFSPGSWFGGPPGYLRINLACPRSQLEEGLHRLSQFNFH